MEYRTVQPLPEGHFKDLDEKRHEVCVSYPARRIDSFGTDFDTGTFEEGWQRRKPAMVWQHDIRDIIGRCTRTQSLRDSHEVTAQFSDLNACPRARQAFTQLRDGHLDSWSFGFDRIADRAHPEVRGARRITKAYMVEISPVTEASIPGTKTLSLRQRQAVIPRWSRRDRAMMDRLFGRSPILERRALEVEYAQICADEINAGVDIDNACDLFNFRMDDLDARCREQGVRNIFVKRLGRA